MLHVWSIKNINHNIFGASHWVIWNWPTKPFYSPSSKHNIYGKLQLWRIVLSSDTWTQKFLYFYAHLNVILRSFLYLKCFSMRTMIVSHITISRITWNPITKLEDLLTIMKFICLKLAFCSDNLLKKQRWEQLRMQVCVVYFPLEYHNA
jgi:hypothetical protein